MYINDDKNNKPILIDYWLKKGKITEKIQIKDTNIKKTYNKITNINIHHSNKKLN